jgi:hypothetical protein
MFGDATMKKLILTAAISLAALTSAHANGPSYPSTAWVAECSTPAKVVGDNVNTCRAYIHGLINALAIWQYVSPETAIVCIPAGADFGKVRDQILPQVKKQARPDISASVLLTHVLSEHFSCQPKT